MLEHISAQLMGYSSVGVEIHYILTSFNKSFVMGHP